MHLILLSFASFFSVRCMFGVGAVRLLSFFVGFKFEKYYKRDIIL